MQPAATRIAAGGFFLPPLSSDRFALGAKLLALALRLRGAVYLHWKYKRNGRPRTPAERRSIYG